MSKPVGDGLDAHHLPANSATNIAKGKGPTIQMLAEDHRNTSSWGNSKEAKAYRQQVKQLMEAKQGRKALALEIRDVRNVARKAGYPRRYNRALQQASRYAKPLTPFKK